MKDLLNAMTSLIFPLVFSGCSLPWILCSTFRNVKGRGTGMSRRLDFSVLISPLIAFTFLGYFGLSATK
jgi:hypothetical protein